MKKKNLISLLFILLLTGVGNTYAIDLLSPNARLQITVNTKDSITYKVLFDGKEIVAPSAIGIILNGKSIVQNPQVQKVDKQSVRETITPLYGKFKTLQDEYNEVTIALKGDYSLIVRAYDEGFAYRFVTDMKKDLVVTNEIFQVNINDNPAVTYAETNNYTAWELMYLDYASVSSIIDGKRAVTPVLFSMPQGLKVVVAESDVRDYPGLYMVKEKNGFHANFAQYPDSIAMGSWGDFVTVVQRRKNHIAEIPGKKEFPWRIVMVTDDDKTLLTNELIYKLAKPSVLTNESWIKPGKAAWEWWHDAELPGADIPSGMKNRNTDLYKHYIDFAAEYGLEYMMVDAGWSDIFDLSKENSKFDVQAIINHAKSKDVGIFLWCVGAALRENTDQYMKMMADWGAVGLKVDFFDRDDQLALKWMEDIAAVAAKYQLMINFHGCAKPTGLQRTYPNIVTFEAVRGAECTKWDLTANPKHHVTFPFTRMLAGSLDYTPGAMRNRSLQTFRPLDPGMPYSLGSRCHELAMYVIYDQYFAMLCDSPSEYRKYPDVMRFLSAVPVSFDYTKVLDAKVGEYILMAKQKGEDWYVGGMTNWTAREMFIDFSFLSEGKQYIAEIYKDGAEAGIYADQYDMETKEVNSNTRMKFDLVQGGGVALRIFLK